MVGLWYCNLSGVTELLIMRDPHHCRMCFKSVKILGGLTFLTVKKAEAFSTVKNVELLWPYSLQ